MTEIKNQNGKVLGRVVDGKLDIIDAEELCQAFYKGLEDNHKTITAMQKSNAELKTVVDSFIKLIGKIEA